MNIHLEPHLAELLYKSIRRQLSATEQEELDGWRTALPEHELFYQRVHQEEYIDRELCLFLHGKNKNAPLWEEIRQKSILKHKRKVKRMMGWSAAAAVLCLLIGSFYLFRPLSSKVPIVVAEAVVPGTYKAILYTENGEKFELSDSLHQGLKEGVFVSANQLKYQAGEEPNAVKHHTLVIPRGGEYSLILSDGTKVFLNSESELRYPIAFNSNCREVSLKGEAYFEVTPDTQKPFIVKVENMQVKVLGTSFNVNAYDPAYIEAALVSGKIRVTTDGQKEEWLIKPSELLRFDRENKTATIEETDLWPYIAWKEGQFLFRNQSVGKIMDILARWYDIEVDYRDESIQNLHFTGDIRRHADLTVILNALTASVNVRYTLANRKLTLFYN